MDGVDAGRVGVGVLLRLETGVGCGRSRWLRWLRWVCGGLRWHGLRWEMGWAPCGFQRLRREGWEGAAGGMELGGLRREQV